jgi:GNAT superfamily N-acetyltransferase
MEAFMISIEKIDTTSRSQVNRFVKFPFRLYDGHPQWVPPILADARLFLNRDKHPFYEHSDADFFVAVQDGEIVGRIGAMENRRFNDYHDVRKAQFYLFDSVEDQAVADALFERTFEWARDRGLNQVVGPKGFGPLDGYGIQIEGFEHRQMMTMMNYNYPYYRHLVESIGFEKEVDFVSCYLGADAFRLPERVHRISRRVQERGRLTVKDFSSKRELRDWAGRIGRTYNQSFIENWEYYPLTDNEISFVLDNIIMVADPRLIKVILHGDDVVGFLFGFRDVSAAMQRIKGRLLPFGIVDLLLEMRRTNWVSLNGAGILPEFQGLGGNALLYAEMENTVRDFGFEHAELTQVAETAVQMRKDLENIGGKAYKNHRVYTRDI